jgi:hypothetical protein
MRDFNDNYNNQLATSSYSAMVRQRAFKPTYAKVDSQADGVKERTST